MKNFYFICAGIFLVGCSNVATEKGEKLEQSNLPDVSVIDMPKNLEAANMVSDYLSIMDAKMELASEIGRIHSRDQYVREVFIDMFSNPALDPDVRAAFQDAGGKYVEAIDDINTKEFKFIMQNMTWRDLAKGESRLADRAFSIVQHTNDNAFREATLAEIKPLAEEGLMEGQKYALMYDRVNLKKGKLQLYGSQSKCVNGQYDVFDLAEPSTVNERREKMNMEPLEVYLKRQREYYGPCKDE